MIKSLRLINITCHANTNLEFNENTPLILFTGDVGHGKTSVFESICWLLTEKYSKDKYGDELITHGEDYCIVTMTLNDGTVISREKTRGKSSKLIVTANNVDLKDEQAQKYIYNRLIGSYESFINTAYYTQGTSINFMDANDEGRKNIIEQVSGATKLDKYYKRTKELLVRHEKMYDSIERQIDILIAEIKTLNDEYRIREKEDASKYIKELQGLRRKYNSITEDITKYINNSKSSDVSYQALELLKHNISILNNEYNNSNIILSKLTEVGLVCSNCGHKISKEKYDNLYNEEKKKIKQCISKRNELLEKRDTLLIELNELNELKFKRDTTDIEIKKLKEYIKDITTRVKTTLKTMLSKIHDKAKELHLLEKTHTELELVIIKVKFWIEGFGPKGIRSLLLDGILTDFNRILNLNLNVVLKGVSATSDTEQLTKKEKVLDNFNIRFFKGLHEQKYKMFSGGEKKLINISIVLTLQELVRIKIGNPLKVLFIDEVFDSLAFNGIEKIMELLYTRYGDYQILVISHDEKVKQLFNNTIEF
jgi:DNA repair exonuclease SbcCD ATPase subunit